MCCKNRSYYCGMFTCLGNDYVYQALTFVVTFFFCRSASLWCPIYNQTAKYPLLPVYRARLTNVAQHKFLFKQLQNITAKCKVFSIAALSVSFRFDCKHVVPRHKKKVHDCFFLPKTWKIASIFELKGN